MRIGIIWEGLLELSKIPFGAYPILGEQNAGEQWDCIFDVKDDCIMLWLNDKCIEFQVPVEQQEEFIKTWVMMLNDPTRHFNHDLLDVKKFLFKKGADKLKGRFYIKDYDTELEEEIKGKRNLLVFTGISLGFAFFYAERNKQYLNGRKQMVQIIDDSELKRCIYIFTFEDAE